MKKYPSIEQNALIEMTLAVKNECPVGKFFGKSGVGEGIVFTCITDPSLMFKSKGEKHSVTKVKTLNPVDTVVLAELEELIKALVTESRLEQGLSYFKENNIEAEPKNTGLYLQWVVNDVLKEELDTIEASGIDGKKIKNAISSKARVFYLNHI